MRYTTQSRVRCEQCGRTSYHIYKIPFGENTYNLCSGQCVEVSRQNYEEKKDIRFAPAEERSPDMFQLDMDE